MNAYAGNTEINRLERRIRELEAALSAANGRADFNDTRCAELEAEVERLRTECQRRGRMLDDYRSMMERAMAHIAPEQSVFKEMHEAVCPPTACEEKP
jgi:predicted  nucleic acid-binding Zn-ribbon protein